MNYVVKIREAIDMPDPSCDGIGEAAFRRWLAEAGLPVPPATQQKSRWAQVHESIKPRQEGESLRAYRRRYRAQAAKAAGGVRALRRLRSHRHMQETQWALLAERALPIEDSEGLAFIMRQTAIRAATRYAWEVDTPQGICAGSPVSANVCRETARDTITARDTKRAIRVGQRGGSAPPPLWVRLRSVVHKAMTQAVAAQLKFKKTDCTELYVSRDPGFPPQFSHDPRKSTATAGIRFRVGSGWWRDVYLTGEYAAFGPGTLVIGIKDGVYTCVVPKTPRTSLMGEKRVARGFPAIDQTGKRVLKEIR